MFKWTKRALLAGVIVGGFGALCFGTNFISYVRSSSRIIETKVRDNVPIEFELQRARHHLEDLVPEMHANLRLVAGEEVEVANLERELTREIESIATERASIRKLRTALDTRRANYSFGGREYLRDEVVEELSRRFEHLMTAEKLLEGKENLLRSRRHSLAAAVQRLDRTRTARLELAAQIEQLEAQFRLVQLQGNGGEFQLDQTQLAKTESVIGELKTRLEVAQRVLARKSRFVEMIPVSAVSEDHVVDRVDAYLRNPGDEAEATALVQDGL